MIFLTHLLGGVLALIYLGHFFGISGSAVGREKAALILVSASFALAPDLDTIKSRPGRLLQPFSTVASFLFRHRGFLHSFTFAILVYFGVHYLFSATIAAAATVGYSSHLILDSLTKNGIMPFLPVSRVKLRGFVRTGGLFEKGILAVFALLLFLKTV